MDQSISTWIAKTVITALELCTSVDSESAESPEEQAHRMISGSDGSPSVKVFRMQCDYLVENLELAVNASKGTVYRSQSRHHEIPKLLYWLAIQVQGFLDDCRKDEHMQSALTAALVPMRVSSLGFYLKLYCTALSCNISTLFAVGPASLSQENLESLREAEKHEVERRASRDEANLLDSLRSLIELGKSNSAQATLLDKLKSLIISHTSSKADRNFQLATMVQKRLEFASQAVSTSGPSRSLSLEAWKVDGKNLRRLQKLGAGMSATVYKSEWLGAVIVAEKVFTELSDFDAFEEEISLLATLSHPSIVSILGYWTDEKSSAIVTELMDGDLTDLMAERLMRGNPGMRPFSISVACDTMLQVAEGVEYIHEKGVSHRDLKSQNVLVRRSKDNDIEYVCAKVALSKTKESTSWRFRAPELTGSAGEKITESKLLHPRKSDVYSFGMLCLEILTGEMPFSDIGIPRVVKEMVTRGERPVLPPECPEELRSLIELCWHHEIDKRPYMSEVCERLRRIKYSLLIEDLKSEVRVSAPPPEWYLDKIKQCMEHVQQMTSGPLLDSTGVKLYRRQCQYLEGELKLAVEVCCQSTGKLGILRLLLVLAIQIKGFIEDCCNKEWVKIALISPSVAPAPSVTVSTLIFYLKLTCTVLPDNSNNLSATQLESLREDVELAVAEEARLDEQDLLNALQSPPVSSQSSCWEAILPGMSSSADQIQLAKILQMKLEASQSVSTRSSLHPTETYIKTDRSTIKNKRKLGNGASGTVYGCIWFGAEVAVKSLGYIGADFHESFQNEVSILGGLCHPNIVNILGYSHDDTESNILMDLMDEDLNSFMVRRGDHMQFHHLVMVPFNIDEAVDLMLQVANGVNYLHEHKIVHRDLKSPNILVKVTRSEEHTPESLLCVKVADFGSSVTMERSETYSQQTKVGTSRYMAPEVINPVTNPGILKYPMKSDVYSFGLLCYEILTGEVPFSQVAVPRILNEMVLNGERPELPPQSPSALKTLIEACWHANPSDRPPFKQICQELRRLKYSLLLKESSGESSAQQRYQPARPVSETQLKLQHDLLEHLSRLSVTKVEYSYLERTIQLGRGGAETVVYKTIYDRSNVAEKRYVTAYNEDFKRELTVLADLKHPNIVSLIGFAMGSRSCSIIMELMDGDLHELMRMRMSERKTTPTGPFSLKDAVHIMLQIAQGMHYVHQKNVVHRDLKSYNILVKRTSNARQPVVVKVADFGLSETLQPGSNLRFNIGTVRWMAPEVMMLQNDVNVGKSPGTRTGPVSSKFLYVSNALGNMSLMSDEQVKNYPDPFKSDIYSFGIVCFEILTGCAPTFHLNERDSSVPREKPIKFKPAGFLLFLLLEGLNKLRNNPLLLLEGLNINKDPVKAILVLMLLRIMFEKMKKDEDDEKKDKNEALKEKVLAGHRPRLPKYCPPKLKALIESCWDKDSSSRPSFAQIIAALKDVQ